MAQRTVTKHKIHSGVVFAALVTVLITSCGGSSGERASPGTTVTPPATPITQPPLSTIAAVVADIVSTPYLAGSAKRYLSDCQTGNTIQPAAGCVQGSDTLYDGTSPTISGAHGPWQTTTKGAAWLAGQASGTNTLALAQGGVWNAASDSFAINLAANRYCAAGQTCSEVREYPQGGTGPKPVIYGPNLGTTGSNLFFMGNGQRIMNLALVGSTNGASTSQTGVFLYCNNCLVHDDSILNVDFFGFDIAINEPNPPNYNTTIQGNHFIGNANQGYIGGSQNLNLNYNYFQDNGSHDVAAETHSIYIASHAFITGVNVIGNYVTGYFRGTGATQCTAGPFVLHGSIINLVVSGNALIEDSNSKDICWGISANNITSAAYGGFYRNTLFSNNVIVNMGNAALTVENCPYCVIENNLIIADNASALSGIAAPPSVARTSIANCTPSAEVQCFDDPSTNYTIRNNTVYFGVNATGGMIGIQVGLTGSAETQTGHKVYNNTVTYMATTATGSGFNKVYCFDYPLAASAYSTISNNNCYVPHSGSLNYAWEQSSSRSLSAWNTATGFDSHSSISDPGFTLAAAPYFSGRTDASLMYQLFNNGTTNIFSPSSALSTKGINGPLLDIAGVSRSPTAPSIGAYE